MPETIKNAFMPGSLVLNSQISVITAMMRTDCSVSSEIIGGVSFFLPKK
jgi:hypothetical protein